MHDSMKLSVSENDTTFGLAPERGKVIDIRDKKEKGREWNSREMSYFYPFFCCFEI